MPIAFHVTQTVIDGFPLSRSQTKISNNFGTKIKRYDTRRRDSNRIEIRLADLRWKITKKCPSIRMQSIFYSEWNWLDRLLLHYYLKKKKPDFGGRQMIPFVSGQMHSTHDIKWYRFKVRAIFDWNYNETAFAAMLRAQPLKHIARTWISAFDIGGAFGSGIRVKRNVKYIYIEIITA